MATDKRASGSKDERMKARPIGLFDSGVGGLSVLREIIHLLPYEDTAYFADSAHCPYGGRSREEVDGFSQAITRFLIGVGAKIIVVACNTASAAALRSLRSVFPDMPFIGMVPAVKPAVALTHSKKVGVLATPATLGGDLFADVVSRFASDVEVITQICPGLVAQIEAGDLEGNQTMALLEGYLAPLRRVGVDTLVLGCTHYPFLTPLIRRIVGDSVTIVDPSPAIARQTKRVLAQRSMLKTDGLPGSRGYYTSGEVSSLTQAVEHLVGDADQITRVRWSNHGETIVPQ